MQEFKLLKSKTTIKIPSTAEEWQLYSSSMKCGQSVRALTTALKKAIRAIEKGERADGLMDRFMYPVMDAHASYGASDTEPRNVALDCLERVFTAVTGGRVELGW